LLAEGPINLISAYSEVLQSHNMHPSIVPYPDDDSLSVGTVHAIVAGNSCFIGEEITFQRLK
ncbi:MAG TPA: hypothetical protein VLR94_09025, partial [Acidobacteriota bacterium]|nr:hypothetical protein [Acidobacteriota bacterium]